MITSEELIEESDINDDDLANLDDTELAQKPLESQTVVDDDSIGKTLISNAVSTSLLDDMINMVDANLNYQENTNRLAA